MRGALVAIAGPSGVGKGTIIRRAMARNPDIWLSVSATTREPRPGEEHGKEYVFVTARQFGELIESDGLLEWAEFAGNRYGTPALPVVQRVAKGTTVLLEIDVQGVRQVRQNYPGAKTVFVAPPSVDDLAHRLASRGTEDEATQARRLSLAKEELEAASEFDLVIVNDDIERATDELLRWIADHAH